MVLPIVAYGDAVLRKKAADVTLDNASLEKLIADMWETMESSRGVGLAAPQINQSLRLFVIDSCKMYDEGEEHLGLREVFVNPQIIAESGEEWGYEEGCLSIPGIRAEVMRKPIVDIVYYNASGEKQERRFDGKTARVIQHEYDHIEGKLFIDHIKPLKRALLKGKLEDISRGKIDAAYKMRFAKR
jgi:peptide deformylase